MLRIISVYSLFCDVIMQYNPQYRMYRKDKLDRHAYTWAHVSVIEKTQLDGKGGLYFIRWSSHRIYVYLRHSSRMVLSVPARRI